MNKRTNPASLKRKLFRGAQKGKVEDIQEALDAGIDIHSVDENKWTALHEAVRYCHLDAVQFLLARGADPNVQHPEIGFFPLIVATFNVGNADIVKALIDAGAAPSLETDLGLTAFRGTIEKRDFETMRVLLAAGATPDLRNPPYRTPPEVIAKTKETIAGYGNVRKQTPEEAKKIALSTRVDPPKEPYKDVAPINLESVRVEGDALKVAESEIAAFAAKFKTRLPAGYEEFMRTIGPGILGELVRLYSPEGVLAERKEWLDRIAKYWFWGEGNLLTSADAQGAIRIADTFDGDELVFHPRLPNRVLMLPKDEPEIVLMSESGLYSALARVLRDKRVSRRNIVFEPHPLVFTS